jgi:dihydroorotate dehydrogenase
VTAYKSVVFPIVSRFDAESVHNHTIRLLELAQKNGFGQAVLRQIGGFIPARPVKLGTLTFPNEIGVAAGFDKDVRVAAGLGLLGFGHVEVGTITPRPQSGNPKPRVFRIKQDRAIINRMGFPNCGAKIASKRLQALWTERPDFVIGVSLGKQKETALIDAAADYVEVMEAVYPFVDYLAVNISSPNTPELRDLQKEEYLEALVKKLTGEGRRLAVEHAVTMRPIFLKIAPDLTWSELEQILDIVQKNNVDGIIATNTTLSRARLAQPGVGEFGGLSGAPLAKKSNEIIAFIHESTNGQIPIIGAGGVFTSDGARDKLDAGASLLQMYTGVVYEGPAIAGRILRGL